jgi:hypothetical protein
MKNKNKKDETTSSTKDHTPARDDITPATNDTDATKKPVPKRKEQGGISDYSEVISDEVEYVRGEFLSDHFKPKITFTYKTVTFNMACVNLFPKCQHITISINQKKRRLFVQPTVEYNDISLKFANYKEKEGRNVPRISTTKHFGPELYKLMKWDKNAKYRVLTIYQEFDDKKVMTFNLDDAQEVISGGTETTEDGKKKRKTTIKTPLKWEGRFGYRNDELAEIRQLDFVDSEVIVFDERPGNDQGNIEPKPPTAEELIHEPYGGIRPRKEPKKDD